jgi:hypothetical protein
MPRRCKLEVREAAAQSGREDEYTVMKEKVDRAIQPQARSQCEAQINHAVEATAHHGILEAAGGGGL